MVSGVERSRRKGIRATSGISLAGLVGLHCLIIPDLGSIVKIPVGLGRDMRDKISIMDDSFMVDLRPKPTSKLTVSYPRLSEGHQARNSSETILDIRQSQYSQSASQAMPSEINLRIPMERLQGLDLRDDSSLDSIVTRLEAIMDLAVSASGVRDLVEGQVYDPILDVAAAPKGKDDGVEIR